MGKKKTAKTTPAAAWFDRHDPLGPAAKIPDGMCARHYAPLVRALDGPSTPEAVRIASMQMTSAFIAACRKATGRPAPTWQLAALVRQFGPVCCLLGDEVMYEIHGATFVTLMPALQFALA